MIAVLFATSSPVLGSVARSGFCYPSLSSTWNYPKGFKSQHVLEGFALPSRTARTRMNAQTFGPQLSSAVTVRAGFGFELDASKGKALTAPVALVERLQDFNQVREVKVLDPEEAS